jgi:hypothetical protein
VVADLAEEVVDENKKEQRTKHASLRDTSLDRLEVGVIGVDDHALFPIREVAAKPFEERSCYAKFGKLEEETIVPDFVKCFADVQTDVLTYVLTSALS